MNNDTIINTFWEKLGESSFVMVGVPDGPRHSEPMTAFFDRKLGSDVFIFLADDNRLCQALKEGRRDAMLQYVAKGHDFFACISGQMERVVDEATIDRFWNENVAEWFSGGRRDPKLTMLRIRLRDGEMWSSDMSIKGKVKLMLSGELDRDELETQHAQVAMA
ncbi:MAG: pyridoxamine 5'-phosphate oxidase family protein [Myxococcota bacterium]